LRAAGFTGTRTARIFKQGSKQAQRKQARWLQPKNDRSLKTQPHSIRNPLLTLAAVFAAELAASHPVVEIKLKPIGSYATGMFDEGGAEIVAHDPTTQRVYSSTPMPSRWMCSTSATPRIQHGSRH
jgi:hypothetical protein